MTHTVKPPPKGPGHPHSTVVAALGKKADLLDAFASEYSDRLDFESYASLTETAVRLRAIADTLICENVASFVATQIFVADNELAFFSEYLGLDDAS